MLDTWDYEFTPGYQESPQVQETTQDTSPTTSSSSESSLVTSASPRQPPDSPNPNLLRDPTSPKCSWPTILTASTGQPTEDLSASSSRTLVTLPREVDQPDATGTALVPFMATGKPPLSRGNNKRPVGPVMRLLQEGRSRRNKAKMEVTKSTANTTATTPGTSGAGKPQQHPGQHDDAGAVVVAKNRPTSALAKKLHARVKSEKELKVDPKRRVRAWLKGVEVDLAPIPLDTQGFPIYR